MNVWYIVAPLLVLAVIVGLGRRREHEWQIGLGCLIVIVAAIVAFIMLGGGK